MSEGDAPGHEPGADRPSAGLPSWHLLAGSSLYDNPALFDLVHRGYRGDVDWNRQAVGSTPALVIDLGCGTGRLAIPLADDGHRIIAIDASEAMLALLRPRMSPRHTIGVLAADLRSLTLDVQADVILAACNFLGHFTPQERRDLLRRCAGWLRPGGRLMLDISDATWHRAHPTISRSVPYHDAELGESFAVTASSTLNDGQMSVAFAIHLADATGTPDAQLVEGAVSMWLIDAQDLVHDLASAGFRIDQRLSAFSPDEAEAGGHRVVIVATRADELA